MNNIKYLRTANVQINVITLNHFLLVAWRACNIFCINKLFNCIARFKFYNQSKRLY